MTIEELFVKIDAIMDSIATDFIGAHWQGVAYQIMELLDDTAAAIEQMPSAQPINAVFQHHMETCPIFRNLVRAAQTDFSDESIQESVQTFTIEHRRLTRSIKAARGHPDFTNMCQIYFCAASLLGIVEHINTNYAYR